MSYIKRYSVKRATRPELPQRLVEVGREGDREFEVATAYDAGIDQFRVHVYVTQDGQRNKVPLGDLYGKNERQAFEVGWSSIAQYFGR